MNIGKLSISLEQTEILYNIEYYKTKNDIEVTYAPIDKDKVILLKTQWLEEWKSIITNGFSSFIQIEDASMHWYSEKELVEIIKRSEPEKTWLRLVLLEAIVFEPYFPLDTHKDKRGNERSNNTYKPLRIPFIGYNRTKADQYVEETFAIPHCSRGYIQRLRKCFSKVNRELIGHLKPTPIMLGIVLGAILLFSSISATFASKIAVLLVGSKFGGLTGAALTSACLAYLGGGAIAAGGLGMVGGTGAIVCGGAILGLGTSMLFTVSYQTYYVYDCNLAILHFSKLISSIREIFLNDEHDLAFARDIYNHVNDDYKTLGTQLEVMKAKRKVSKGNSKDEITKTIISLQKTLDVVKVSLKSLIRFISSYQVGMGVDG